MSPQNTESTDREATYSTSERDRRSDSSGLRSNVGRYAQDGTGAVLAGAVLLVDAIRTMRRDRRRAGIDAAVGTTLVGIGLRQRRSSENATMAETVGEPASIEIGETGSGSGIDRDPETSSSTTDESDVGTETEPDEGEVQFTSGRDEASPSRPRLEETDADDPRRSDAKQGRDDDHVSVDLSEASTADEASEATGPDPEQAYPAREGTDPEPTSADAPPRRNQGAVGNKTSDEEGQGIDDTEGDDESTE
ncbi:hypothetical protein RBH26_09670 [Natronolimnohabitans sp. A-GB9]|uniref:hypothetical protein n=1 Tax=Natronolimnohabitans sp. A-GB9 TaxID=3069757 RepID=UPI0027B61F5E|nr:hypothetical protein [Natronolimnohabitans sp. A-GB9]MDQ2050754.1 hypothetical protein [Natronolimnohabitans sp. A-GB9]